MATRAIRKDEIDTWKAQQKVYVEENSDSTPILCVNYYTANPSSSYSSLTYFSKTHTVSDSKITHINYYNNNYLFLIDTNWFNSKGYKSILFGVLFWSYSGTNKVTDYYRAYTISDLLEYKSDISIPEGVSGLTSFNLASSPSYNVSRCLFPLAYSSEIVTGVNDYSHSWTPAQNFNTTIIFGKLRGSALLSEVTTNCKKIYTSIGDGSKITVDINNSTVYTPSQEHPDGIPYTYHWYSITDNVGSAQEISVTGYDNNVNNFQFANISLSKTCFPGAKIGGWYIGGQFSVYIS